MDYEVLKPFNTVNRRFKPADVSGSANAEQGNIVLESEDLSPLTFDDLEKRGFIKPRSAEPSVKSIPVPPVMPPVNKLDTAADQSAAALTDK